MRNTEAQRYRDLLQAPLSGWWASPCPCCSPWAHNLLLVTSYLHKFGDSFLGEGKDKGLFFSEPLQKQLPGKVTAG